MQLLVSFSVFSSRPVADNLPNEPNLQLLNELLDSETYEAAGQLWASPQERKKVCQLWHRIESKSRIMIMHRC